MKRISIILIMISSLSYGQITKKSIFNQKNDTRLNKSFGVLNQKKTPEKLISYNDYELNLENFDVINQKNNKNTTPYSSKKNSSTIQLDSISYVGFDEDGITRKTKIRYNENGNRTLEIDYYWNSETSSFEPSSKYERTFDANGNRTLEIGYNWNSETVSFEPSSKYEWTYDANGNPTLQINYNWNSETASFEPYSKNERTYDANSNRTLEIDYNWNSETASFEPSFKYEWTFDANGNRTLQINYNWNSETASFEPSSKYERTFDANGNRTLEIGYNWNSETASLEPLSKYEWTFDANGNRTLEIDYYWNSETASFEPSSKTETSFDEDRQIVGLNTFSWNSVIEVFFQTSKQEYEFDEQMRIVSENTYNIDICNNEKVQTDKTEFFYIDGLDGQTVKYYNNNQNGGFTFEYSIGRFYENGILVLATQTVNPEIYNAEVYTWKNEYEYDENGNQTLITRYRWDTQVDDLIPSYKLEYTYDDENKIKEEIFYKWYNGLGLFKASFKKEYDVIIDTDTKRVEEALLFAFDTNYNQWNALEDEKYNSYRYYTKTSTLSSLNFNKNISLIFPNPTTNFIKVRLSEELSNPLIEIYDATGKKVLSKQIVSDESIDIEALTPAVYFYKIKDGKENKQSGKIIKE